MGLSTHVLDTMHGCPAKGMQVALYIQPTDTDEYTLLKTFTLNADGRNPEGLLVEHDKLKAAR